MCVSEMMTRITLALIGQWSKCTSHDLRELDLFLARVHWSLTDWMGRMGLTVVLVAGGS